MNPNPLGLGALWLLENDPEFRPSRGRYHAAPLLPPRDGRTPPRDSESDGGTRDSAYKTEAWDKVWDDVGMAWLTADRVIPDPAEFFDFDEVAAARAIEALAPRDRRVCAAILDGLDVSQIAESEGKTRSAIYESIERSACRLRARRETLARARARGAALSRGVAEQDLVPVVKDDVGQVGWDFESEGGAA
ncbi:hypothetical protein HF668_06975 [Acidithiobacillus ferridurans]|uniref:hypothetical protein n=1 Tax=Acidithiobacillus ferridurans TaxID=1232575 RepID=UPI001C06AE29|nr:hypothetical protein [Acidithiobacillus ferridurans]MBU2804891.1 hypothetical protein [Acidithiobacillus ferridurans]